MRVTKALTVLVMLIALLPIPSAHADGDVAIGGKGRVVRAKIESTTSGGGSGGSSSGATVTTSSGGGGGAPAPGPRVSRNKRGIIYDYSHLGGGEMHYVFDDTRDWCHGGVKVSFCYGPKPKPEPGRPRRPGVPPPPPITPTQVVEQTIVNVRLPNPKPNVDPGYAVTGMKAYLETGNSTRHTFDPIPTVLGPLSITASSTYTVDWGDGTTTGPHTSNGGKYPNGTITHVYGDAETVDITVTQSWTAQWSLAGQSGTITGLSSSGDLPNFVVKEVQAVRNR